MKIFVLAGKTMSGKTTIANILENDFDINRTRSFTTRPKRDNEIDGIDYDFYEQQTVLLLVALGKVTALRAYQPHISFGPYPWYYGFNKGDILKKDNSFLITDYGGIKDLKKEFGEENVFTIYLDISEEDQVKRLSDRGKDLEDEQLRRIKSDNLDFMGIKDDADHIIKATKQPMTIAKEIAKLIEKNS